MTGEEFARNAENLIGRRYSDVDCIGVVRLSANIRCSGTNWLWRSYHNSKKYQYLTERADIAPARSQVQDGLLVFRVRWGNVPEGYSDTPNCYHVGVIQGDTVIQSNPGPGVYKSPYKPEDWDACGMLKSINYSRPFLMDDIGIVDDDIYTPSADTLSDRELLERIYYMLLLRGDSID